jgi:hypothetical protein
LDFKSYGSSYGVLGSDDARDRHGAAGLRGRRDDLAAAVPAGRSDRDRGGAAPGTIKSAAKQSVRENDRTPSSSGYTNQIVYWPLGSAVDYYSRLLGARCRRDLHEIVYRPLVVDMKSTSDSSDKHQIVDRSVQH